MDKLLTIVIPVYNTDLTKLERCLKSIPNHPDIYVDIYDDCSTKYCTESEISRIIKKNENLRHLYKEGNGYIKANENIGLGAIRNRSIERLYKENSNNRFVLFLDSDDEVSITEEIINTLKALDKNYKVIGFGIDLISGSNVYHEHNKKFLTQNMIPYFITSNIYDVEFLYKNNIKFDESRRIFEDIMFSINLWTKLSETRKPEPENENLIFSNSVIYKYYLEGESLTRNDKYATMIRDLNYWVEWIQDRYSSLSNESKDNLKSYYFNRIRYEKIKSLELEMKLNGDIDKYKDIIDYLKPHKIDNVLS